MRAAVTTAPNRVEIVERPAPVAGEGQVLVRVECVGVCGTDAHIWAGEYPASSLPLVQGHEITGWAGGERVVVEPAFSCGRCHACQSGRANACARSAVLGVHLDGALAEAVVVPAAHAHPAPGLSATTAAVVEPAAIALQAVERSLAPSEAFALVLGCGPIGLLATRALADRGARVAALDRDPARAERARRFGAEFTTAVDGRPDPRQRAALAEWAGGEGPSVVVEATGAPAALATALDLVVSAGRVVTVGISAAEARLPMNLLPYKELDLVGSRNSRALFPAAIDFVRRHRALAEDLVTHRLPLARTAEAFALAHHGDAAVGKILIEVP
ncbi:alcohol dehydrogenase catalytic domain-containing protein [Amycolatopsis dongchuanensis]|uniref:Zinc-binding alcohol dehydrogenase family protein n=1 Tax=Amycolatopsis dongchuanensis TaxID=1070866 RepID=A0ABP8VL14_9PSEU